MVSTSQPRIAIAGGGPAALTLGVLLHQRSIPYTILELRPQPTEADLAQTSGMLDLHEDSGLAALRACGLLGRFASLTADCEESMVVADKDGVVLHADRGGPGHRPEISRHSLSGLLLSALPGDAIRWDTKVLAASRRGDTGEVTLELESGGAVSSETFDLVVGADGAWSRIRPLLSEAKPQPTGLHYVSLVVKDVGVRFPELAALVGQGSFFALGNKHGILCHHGTQDSTMVSPFFNDSDIGEEAVAKLTRLSIGELRKVFLEDERLYGGYGDVLKELVNVAFDDEVAARGNLAKLEVKPLVMLPVGHAWEHKLGVTLVGDAAHLMLPTAGEGVNQAMQDALGLSEVITQAWTQAGKGEFTAVLSPLVREFERVMLTRAQGFSEESLANKEMMFAEDGARAMADLMATVARGPPA